MSTRCNIIVKDEKSSVILYHHHDGYPSGVGAELKSYIKENDFLSAMRVANSLVKDEAGLSDTEYELTSGIHGDIEFLYVVDCDSKELKCYSVPEWDMTAEDIVKPENEREIPD